MVAISVAMASLCACASRGAPDFDGRWQPVNRYAERTRAIPLRPANVFRPAPMDRTLRAMLARWSRESGLRLDYRHPSDFLLHAEVAAIASPDVSAAVSQIDAVFAPEGVRVSRDGGAILVEVRRPPATAAVPDARRAGATGLATRDGVR